MKWPFLKLFVTMASLFCWIPTVGAEFDYKFIKQLNLPTHPLDLAVSPNEKWFFILTKGQVVIFSVEDNRVEGTIPVDSSFEKVIHSPQDNSLILVSTEKKKIQVIRVDAIFHFSEKGSPVLGPENAPVTLTIFFHYQCPFCKKLDPKIEELRKFFEDKLKIVFKAFPSYNQVAINCWAGAIAASRQAKFWAFHKALHEKEPPLNDKKIKSAAKEVGLNMKEFNKAMEDQAVMEQIGRDVREGMAAEVNGVPTLFINGKHLENEDLGQIYQYIQEEIKSTEVPESTTKESKPETEKRSK